MTDGRSNNVRRMEEAAQIASKITKALLDAGRPLCRSELVEATGLPRSVIFRHTKKMVNAGALHIAEYAGPEGAYGAIFALGPSDAEPLKRPRLTAEQARQRNNELMRRRRAERGRRPRAGVTVSWLGQL